MGHGRGADQGEQIRLRPLERALSESMRQLSAAGIDAARTEALILAAFAAARQSGAEITPGEIQARALSGAEQEPEGFAPLIAQRAQRIPLQHLTGTAPFRHLELSVGPGVFIPRPETEVLIDQLHVFLREHPVPHPVIVDLASGSGALALAAAQEVPQAEVHAVELSSQALAWARRNVQRLQEASGPRVELVSGDAAEAFPELLGQVDVVLSNPPYIPETMVPKDPEVAEHDPALALYGGSADGLRLPRAFAARAAELLRPGGLLVMEHAEVQAAALRCILEQLGFTEVQTVRDLTGRDRAVRGYAGEAAARPASSSVNPAEEVSS